MSNEIKANLGAIQLQRQISQEYEELKKKYLELKGASFASLKQYDAQRKAEEDKIKSTAFIPDNRTDQQRKKAKEEFNRRAASEAEQKKVAKGIEVFDIK